MAKLERLPDARTIRAFKGTIDFYVVRGQHIARQWPTKTKHVPTQAEIDQQNHLKNAMAGYNSISPIEKSYLYLQSWPGTFTTRDVFIKQFFGTMLYPKPFPAFFYPRGQHIPFPDPQQTYFGVRSRQMIVGSDGRWKQRMLFTSPGDYTWNYRAVFPTTSLHMYRRRGIEFTGAVEWFFPTGLLTITQPSDANGLVDFDYAIPLGQIGANTPFYYWFSKSHPGGTTSRAFTATFGHNMPNELSPPSPPGSLNAPGSTMTWPASPPFQGAYLFQPVAANPFSYTRYPPPRTFINPP